jgi:hypothetical protein
MRYRSLGAWLVGFAAVFAYIVFGMRLTSARLVVGIPLLAATGLWLLVFGHPVVPSPVDGEPIAPLWWRLGLVGFVGVSMFLTHTLFD